MLRLLASASALVLLAACTTTVVANDPPPGDTKPAPGPDTSPPPKCVSAACPGDQSCQNDFCADPTDRQKAQAASVAALADTLADSSAWFEVVDVNAVKAKSRATIMKGDGSDQPYFEAAWYVMNAFPQGHQGMYSQSPSVCGKSLPGMQASRFGVCGRPSKDGVAVTFANAGNKLGLAVGDVVIAAGPQDPPQAGRPPGGTRTESGDALFEASYRRPMCGSVFPAKSGRRYAGAASFFGNVPAGTKLTVRAPSGATRDVVVPATGDAKLTDCTDPFGRSTQIYAEAKVRPDGVAVIRLPSFHPFDKPIPTTASQAEIDKYIADFQAEIVKVFETVKSAPAIVWDARGNTGGITAVGLAIVGGFASARTTKISYCKQRTPGTSPPEFGFAKYAEYTVTPGGPFAYAGKVAVVADGLAYSAGDYFPLAVVKASDAPLVGSASAGAYGSPGPTIDIDGPPKLIADYDANGCFDAITNAHLEASPPPPTVPVEYEPADLAAGKDPVVERAVKQLGF